MGCSNSNVIIETKQNPIKRKKSIKDSNILTKIESIREIITTPEDIKIKNNNLVRENKNPIKNIYEIVKKIGSGTFAKVYQVIHIPTKQLRAMKVVKLDTVNYQDDDQVFLKEIELLSQLNHPNIIKIYEYFLDDVGFQEDQTVSQVKLVNFELHVRKILFKSLSIFILLIFLDLDDNFLKKNLHIVQKPIYHIFYVSTVDLLFIRR